MADSAVFLVCMSQNLHRSYFILVYYWLTVWLTLYAAFLKFKRYRTKGRLNAWKKKIKWVRRVCQFWLRCFLQTSNQPWCSLHASCADMKLSSWWWNALCSVYSFFCQTDFLTNRLTNSDMPLSCKILLGSAEDLFERRTRSFLAHVCLSFCWPQKGMFTLKKRVIHIFISSWRFQEMLI